MLPNLSRLKPNKTDGYFIQNSPMTLPLVSSENKIMHNYGDPTRYQVAAIALYSWRWDKILSHMAEESVSGSKAKEAVVPYYEWKGLKFGVAMFVGLGPFLDFLRSKPEYVVPIADGTTMHIADIIKDIGVKASSGKSDPSGQTKCQSWTVEVETHIDTRDQLGNVHIAVNQALDEICIDKRLDAVFNDVCANVIRAIFSAFRPFDSWPSPPQEGEPNPTYCSDTIPGYAFTGSKIEAELPYATMGFVSASRVYDTAEEFGSIVNDETGETESIVRVDVFELQPNVPVIDVVHIMTNNTHWLCWDNECELILAPGLHYAEIPYYEAEVLFSEDGPNGLVQEVEDSLAENMISYRVSAPNAPAAPSGAWDPLSNQMDM